MLASARTVTMGLALGIAVVGIPAVAGDVSGSARVAYGTTDVDDEESDVVDQDYTVNWAQALSPWLDLSLGYRYNFDRNATEVAGVDDIERRSSQPLFQLTYSRPIFSALLSYAERRNRGSIPADELDLKTTVAQLEWRPRRGPQYSLRFRDDSNVADVALFGRDTDSRTVDFDVIYAEKLWEARYNYQQSDIDNNLTGFELDQERHQVRVMYRDDFFDDRARLDVDAWVSDVSQREIVPTGADLAEPVPARAGLYALDITPELGPLDPAFGLIDGDLQSPVSPRIDIGGANTFRNVGLDLGFTRRVTRLEITVDALSSPGLLWEVYRSSDNLSWQLVAVLTGTFDQAFLRYTLEFPETTDRFFKAVNVSPNDLTNVAVTEMRALLDVDQLGRRDTDATTYRVDLSATVRPHERVTGIFGLDLRNDQDVAGARLSRDTDEVTYNALLLVDLTENLVLSTGYRFDHFEENLAPVLTREEKQFTGGLEWRPLPTFRGTLNFLRRDESDDGRRIRLSNTLSARASAELYAGLLLVSDITLSDIDDPFSGFEQTTLRWSETLESRPTDRWSLGGGWSLSWFDTTGTVSLSRLINVYAFTTWQIVPYLTLTADANFRDDDDRQTLTQGYALIWTPGRKLSASIYYRDSDSDGGRRTTTDGFSLNYRMARRLRWFASLTRSTTDDVAGATTEIANARVGLNVTF